MNAVTYETLTFPATEEAELTLPGGEIVKLSSFKHWNIEFDYDVNGIESVKKIGEEYDAVRFYPTENGIYTLKTNNEIHKINVSDSGLHGYVKVSDLDRRYFRWSDGTPITLLGINLAFISPVDHSAGYEFGRSNERYFIGLRQYERYFRQCYENGVNMARIWLGHEYFSPDTEDADVFLTEQFSKIEAVLELARKYNIVLKLTIEQFRFFDYERTADSSSFSDRIFRTFGKRLYRSGKRCESSKEWLSNSIWRDAWKEKLRQLSIRFSGHPSIFGIELWNEMNCVSEKELVIDWNKEMLPFAKSLFPNQLVMNSLGSYDCIESEKFYHDFCWEYSDIMQVHRYLDLGAAFDVCHKSCRDLTKDAVESLSNVTKPFIVAETGAVNPCHCGPFTYYPADHRGTIFCDVVYTPLFSGAASCGHIWHWDERYVEAKNLYPYFKPLSNVCKDIIFDEQDFVSKTYENGDTILILLKGKSTSIGYLRNKLDNWDVTLRDLKQPVFQSGSFKLECSGKLSTFNIWDDEKADITYTNGTLVFSDLKYGMIVRFDS